MKLVLTLFLVLTVLSFLVIAKKASKIEMTGAQYSGPTAVTSRENALILAERAKLAAEPQVVPERLPLYAPGNVEEPSNAPSYPAYTISEIVGFFQRQGAVRSTAPIFADEIPVTVVVRRANGSTFQTKLLGLRMDTQKRFFFDVSERP